MAEGETPEADRTEAASHKRLQQAREDGNIAVHHEFNDGPTFAVGTATLRPWGGARRDAHRPGGPRR